MNELSVLLPVHNAQKNLAGGVNEILEVLSELAGRFELVILDDGSTDDTADAARDLAARYPQIRIIRHPVRLGLAEAIQTGLDHAQGDIILLGDEDYCLDPDDLRTLWQLRDAQWRMTRPNDVGEIGREDRIEKLLAWRGNICGPRRGFQIIPRPAFEQFRMRQAADMRHRVDAARADSAAAIAQRLGHPKYLKAAYTAGDRPLSPVS